MVLRTRLRCAPRILGPPRLVRRDSRVSCRVTERRLGTRPLAVANAPFKTRLSLREITRATRGIYGGVGQSHKTTVYLFTHISSPSSCASVRRAEHANAHNHVYTPERRADYATARAMGAHPHEPRHRSLKLARSLRCTQGKGARHARPQEPGAGTPHNRSLRTPHRQHMHRGVPPPPHNLAYSSPTTPRSEVISLPRPACDPTPVYPPDGSPAGTSSGWHQL